MLNNKITFISVQPDVPYFHWQVEVMINNFISVGIDPSWIEVIFSYNEEISDEIKQIMKLYPKVGFFFYKKTIIDNHGYIPILRPDSLEQHFNRFPNLKNETIFYHDSDIIFRELPDFDKLNGDDVWYLSDTISYIGSRYIRSKSEDLFLNLCKIADIDPSIVESNELSSGGAQYLMKNVDAKFWSNVKKDCLSLYIYMKEREQIERSSMSEAESKNYNPIQKWCSDMWSVLWNAWKDNRITKISNELDFSWGTSNLNAYNKCKIMHNAGVTTSKNGLFYKGDFMKRNPFNEDLSFVKRDTASYKYVEAILYAKENRLNFR